MGNMVSAQAAEYAEAEVVAGVDRADTEAGGKYLSLQHDRPWFDGPCGMLACNAECEDRALRILQEALS